MNEAQRRELQQIRNEQTTLADRLARLETRLRAIEEDAAAETSAPLEISAAKLPPLMPLPVAPPAVPPPLPPEAFAAPKVEASPEPPVPRKEPTATKESLEVRIGTTWLVRVGVVMMLTALAFIGSYLYKNVVPHLGPAVKVGLLYLGAGALAGAGAWLERGKEAARSPRMLNFARVVLAGGLAAVYYVTYAAHWNPNLRVLGSAWADGTLLIGWAGFMVWLADRRGSELLATFAVLLAYYASAVNEIAAFTLFSNLLLTLAAVYLLRRHLWQVFPYASLAATFGSYWFWRSFQPGVLGQHEAGSFWLQAAFLAVYWLLFTWSVVAPGAADWTPRRRAAFATLNNAAFFLLTTWLLAGAYPGAFWKWLLGFGVVLCALAEACRRVRPRVDSETEGAYLLQGILLVTLGFFAYFSAWQLSLVLAAQSVVLLGHAQARRERLPLWAALVSALASFVVAAEALGDGQTLVPWLSAAGTGALLGFNAWWSQRRWDRLPAVPADDSSPQPDFPTTLAVAPAWFATLGSGLWLWTIERALKHEVSLVPVLAVGAAVLTASVYILRVPTLPILAPAFLLAAYVHRFADDNLAEAFGHSAPAWSMAGLLLVTLGIGHWWQRNWPGVSDRKRPTARTGAILAGFHAALAVALMYDWLRPGNGDHPTAAVWIAELALLSLALLVYGRWTRYRSLAVAGQGLLLASFAGCALRIWPQPWSGGFGGELALTLVPLTVLLTTIFVGRRATPGAWISAWLQVYEFVGTAFFLAWVCRYVPSEARFTVLSLAGALVAGWAQVRREPRWLWWGGGLTLAGVSALALLPRTDQASLLHTVGVAAIAGQQRFARWWAKREPAVVVPSRWQAGWMIAATLCAWGVVSARMTLSFEGAFTLAAAWSVFAALVFLAGLTLREKVYRWLGLGILVFTMGRIATVDIWQLDSLGRAISALCLGTVLLGIGYLYNRFHARWHDLF